MKIIKNQSDYITKVTQSGREIREALHIFTKQSIPKKSTYIPKIINLIFSGGEDTDLFT